ncbi:hypothetical protein H0A65_01325 [Alcaligenaceae bacterium]|nr:hypothetical protein [Alcaligenaceae bacterium]
MKRMLWRRAFVQILLAGAGAVGLGWVFQAWLGADMLLAFANSTFGCG